MEYLAAIAVSPKSSGAMMNGQEFGRRLRQEREARGLTQPGLGMAMATTSEKEFGEAITNVSPVTVSHWESGNVPRRKHALLICLTLRVPPERLALESLLPDAEIRRIFRSSRCRRIVVSTRELFAKSAARTLDASAQYDRTMALVDAEEHGPGTPCAPRLDWERLEFVMRTMRRVDARTVEDQWMLTHRYLADRRAMRVRSLLELMTAHISRLRQLQTQTADNRLCREITIMLAQTLVAAGQGWTGLTDFGMALDAYRTVTALGDELGENWLRVTGLLSQAQLSGIHVMAPWTPAARLALMQQTEAATKGISPQVGVWIHATRAQMYAILGQQSDALRSLQEAGRAEALVPRGSGYYFGMADPLYVPIQEASVALMSGRHHDAVVRFETLSARVEPSAAAIRAWVAVYLAAAYAEAGDIERAIPALRVAREMAQNLDCPLLAHSVARYATLEAPAADQRSPVRTRHQLDTDG